VSLHFILGDYVHIVNVDILSYFLQGNPSEKGLYLDAQAAFEYVESREDLDSKKIILFGRSLGILNK
jgi:fermentation-respiration switch protein FrsA (DUF1100 family)